MTLDPQAAALIKATRKSKLPALETLSPAQARIQQARGITVVAGHGPAMHAIQDFAITGHHGDIPLRLYRPSDTMAKPQPILVFIHGGGHVLGSIDSHDVACRYLALHADCIVVSVGYHRAPEYPFPAPLEDCCRATQWIIAHAEQLGGRGDRVAIAGDSAGGNLATAVCLQRRNAGNTDLCGQLLFYPATDLTCSMPSHAEYADYAPTTALLAWFIGHYMDGTGHDRDNPRCSPLFASSLTGLPPAIIVSAGHDPLRDEAVAYHDKLLAQGVASQHLHYPGMVHGFINMTGFLDAARECLQASGHLARTFFHRSNEAASPIAKARARGMERRRRILKQAGGTVPLKLMAEREGLKPESIRRRIQRGALIALRDRDGYHIPAIQLDDTGRQYEHLGPMLADLANASPYRQLQWLMQPHSELDGQSPIDIIRNGQDHPMLRPLARAFGEQGGG